MACEHCRSSERAAVCNNCWFAQVKANKRLLDINERTMYDAVRLQHELDNAQDEIDFLRKELSKNVIRLKVKE
jgi:hypothetical protein